MGYVPRRIRESCWYYCEANVMSFPRHYHEPEFVNFVLVLGALKKIPGGLQNGLPSTFTRRAVVFLDFFQGSYLNF